jgi:hypothetical protein
MVSYSRPTIRQIRTNGSDEVVQLLRPNVGLFRFKNTHLNVAPTFLLHQHLPRLVLPRQGPDYRDTASRERACRGVPGWYFTLVIILDLHKLSMTYSRTIIFSFIAK